MADVAVRSAGLHVVRGGATVLHSLNFEVGVGRVVGLLGPSGCGKSTLMRAIVGTQIIAGGAIEVLGRPAGDPSLRSEIGYSSQAASVYDDLSVVENVRYFAAATRAPNDVERVLAQVELSDYRNRITATLSGGQRSRVSLAVALLGKPRLLVLDEPTVGLDPVLRESLWQTFHTLRASGMTLLVSSHVMEEAERCDELLLLREGRLLAHDTAEGLRTRTATTSMDEAFMQLISSEHSA